MKSLGQTAIENLLAHVLTMDNLRPLAASIEALLEDRLAEVQKSLENIMDAIEKWVMRHISSSATTVASGRKKKCS
ncbi:MAG: hypothetical protein JNM70_23855, partial [Anaerolineae bacterium]|nr:hypothetical protein [Anaerolineae bacterium]